MTASRLLAGIGLTFVAMNVGILQAAMIEPRLPECGLEVGPQILNPVQMHTPGHRDFRAAPGGRRAKGRPVWLAWSTDARSAESLSSDAWSVTKVTKIPLYGCGRCGGIFVTYRVPKANAEALARILQAKFKDTYIGIAAIGNSKIMVYAGWADQDEVAQWIPESSSK